MAASAAIQDDPPHQGVLTKMARPDGTEIAFCSDFKNKGRRPHHKAVFFRAELTRANQEEDE